MLVRLGILIGLCILLFYGLVFVYAKQIEHEGTTRQRPWWFIGLAVSIVSLFAGTLVTVHVFFNYWGDLVFAATLFVLFGSLGAKVGDWLGKR